MVGIILLIKQIYNMIIGKSWKNDTRILSNEITYPSSNNSRIVILDGLINHRLLTILKILKLLILKTLRP